MKKPEGYVRAELGFHQTRIIEAILKEAGVEGIPKEKLHCTLMYYNDIPMHISPPKYDPEMMLSAKVTGAGPLGKYNEETNEWNAFVLNFDSDDLLEEHKRWLEAGYSHSFDHFIPHMSVVYKVSDDKVAELTVRFQKLIGETFIFNNIRSEPIEP